MAYFNELSRRVDAQFGKHVEEPLLTKILEFSRDVALESFKNGLAAGKAKSASRERSARKPTRPE